MDRVLPQGTAQGAQRINRNAVTVGDYAVLVQGLGVNQLTRRQVAEFMSHYGEVASVSFDVGNLLKAEQDLSEARVKLAELKAWNEHGKGGGDGGGARRVFPRDVSSRRITPTPPSPRRSDASD